MKPMVMAGHLRAGTASWASVSSVGETSSITPRTVKALAAAAEGAEAPRERAAGVVAALVTGDQRAIDHSDWNLFRTTGVAHLMSISGLHITMFAWLAAALLGAQVARRAASHGLVRGGVSVVFGC